MALARAQETCSEVLAMGNNSSLVVENVEVAAVALWCDISTA